VAEPKKKRSFLFSKRCLFLLLFIDAIEVAFFFLAHLYAHKFGNFVVFFLDLFGAFLNFLAVFILFFISLRRTKASE
jgi:uncharacterized membrane protein (DUF485 family)